MSRLNIVMTTDENYIVPTLVTIYSFVHSACKTTTFSIYILCARNFDYHGRDLLRTIQRVNSEVNIEFLEIDDTIFGKAITTAHIPIASYYRLFISQMLQEERCLFIDGDMIITEDLSGIYNIDLDGYYAAGVKDLSVLCNWNQHKDYADILEIPDMKSYVNAGFMIYNLKMIREDRLGDRMVQAIENGYKFMDQDIINKFFYGKIKIIPLKYDFFTEYYGSISKRRVRDYSPEELNKIKETIAVYHYTGFFKPWLCTKLKINQLWWNEAKCILDKKLFDKAVHSAKEIEKKSEWDYILNLVGNNSIAVFGYSDIGRMVAGNLMHSNKKVIVFVDNDKNKIGQEYKRVPVISVESAIKNNSNVIYIVSSQNAYKQIISQLMGLGVSGDKIIRYIHKDETYFERLDDKYMGSEVKLFEM